MDVKKSFAKVLGQRVEVEDAIRLGEIDEAGIVALGAIQDETKGFGYDATVEPRDFDKYETDS